MMAEVTRQHVRVGDAQLSMLVAGPEKGEPVVLLHGIPAGAELWREGLLKLSEEGLRAYAPDLPGYGQTRLPREGDYSLEGAAVLIANWLQQEQMPPVWLVGHDIGGGVAQIMVVRSSPRINRLTLSNAAVEDYWPVLAVRMFRLLAEMRLVPLLAATGLATSEPFFGRELRKGFHKEELLKQGDTRSRIFQDTKFTDPQGRREFAAHLRALDNRQTQAVASQLVEVQVPTLLLWGEEDPFQPWKKTGKRLKQLLPRAQVELLDQASHFAMLDQPDAFYDTLLSWRRSE